jgi:hypothetical protein
LWIRTISKAVEKQIKDARADILLLQQNQEKSLGSVMTDLVMTRDLLNKDSMQSERREVFQWLYDANHGRKSVSRRTASSRVQATGSGFYRA